MAFDKILEQHRAERDHLGEILFKALWENMPWGLKVALPNGASAVLTELNDASRPYRQPIYEEDGTAELTPDMKIIGHREWGMMFDFKLKNCDQDHIEITARITGGGGAV